MRQKRVHLDKNTREQILRQFSKGLSWINDTTKEKDGSLKYEVRLRTIADLIVKIKFYLGKTLLVCESSESDLYAKLEIGKKSASLNGLMGSCNVNSNKNKKGIAFTYNVNIVDENKTIIPKSIETIQEGYKNLLRFLQDKELYYERLDPSARQFEIPEGSALMIKKLKESLVFAMSHGSHELFHSNIWAWLIERNPRFVKVFFPNVIGKFRCVRREQKNRDLTIWMDVDGLEYAYVVENKFKSFPREDQLKKYQNDLDDKFKEGLLVTLNTVPKGFNLGAWKACTQSDVCKNIDRMIGEGIFSEIGKRQEEISRVRRDRELVEDYVDMTKKMAKILAIYERKLGDRWALSLCRDRGEDENDSDLEDVKLGDIFRKINAAKMCYYLESCKKVQDIRKRIEDFNGMGLRLEITHDFLHKLPVLNCDVVKRYDESDFEKKLSLGVMIQGTSFARSVCSFDKTKFSDAKTLYKALKGEVGWFDDPDFLLPGLRLGSRKKKFKQYVTDKYTVAYQDIGLVKDSFKWIGDKVIEQMELILKLLEHSQLDGFFIPSPVTEDDQDDNVN